MNILKQLRESTGREAEELAKIAGITVEWYYDLEADDDELDCAISVGAVARLARELGVRPSVLYGGASAKAISIGDLALGIREHLRRSGKSPTEFGGQVGYSVDEALADPNKFRDFNADGLRATCDAVSVNWFDVLDHLEDT